MYFNRQLRAAAAIDPAVAERERADLNRFQVQQRHLAAIELMQRRVEYVERLAAAGFPLRYRELETAKARLDHHTAAAVRAGIIRPRKDAA